MEDDNAKLVRVSDVAHILMLMSMVSQQVGIDIREIISIEE